MPNPPFSDAPAGTPPKVWNIAQFSGVNTQAQRPAIGDQEFSWLQNYFPIGDGNMRTLWTNASAIYSAPGGKTIIYFYPFNLFGTLVAAVFFSDGTAVQVNLSTGSSTTISSNTGDFYSGAGPYPAASQWNAAGIVFVTEASNPNGYFAWGSGQLYRPGQPAPDWLTDETTTTMPSGVHGIAVETYGNRSWVATPPEPQPLSPGTSTPSIILNSVASNGADFNVGDGGGAVPQQDASLRYSFTALRQTNGFLYYMGDSATGCISNVQTVGGITSYSNQNVDPQKGTPWPATVQPFTTQYGPGILFANPQGVYLLVGGSVQKVSYDLDGIFANGDFQTLIPSAALAIVFGVTVYSLLLKTVDLNGNPAVIMCMTDGRPKGNGLRWWFASQTNSLTFIATSELNSTLTTWGTDGSNIFQCFAAASSSLTKTFQTKFFPGQSPAEYIMLKKLYRFYFMAIDNVGTGVTLTGTLDSDQGDVSYSINNTGAASITFVNDPGNVITFVNNTSGVLIFVVSGIALPFSDAACYGSLLGTTMSSTSTDYTLVALTMLYSNDAPRGG